MKNKTWAATVYFLLSLEELSPAEFSGRESHLRLTGCKERGRSGRDSLVTIACVKQMAREQHALASDVTTHVIHLF